MEVDVDVGLVEDRRVVVQVVVDLPLFDVVVDRIGVVAFVDIEELFDALDVAGFDVVFLCAKMTSFPARTGFPKSIVPRSEHVFLRPSYATAVHARFAVHPATQVFASRTPDRVLIQRPAKSRPQAMVYESAPPMHRPGGVYVF